LNTANRKAKLAPTAVLLGCTALLCICQPAAAVPAVALHAALTPEHLGAGTTIRFALTVTPPPGQFPPALREIALRYPTNLGIATSGLGTATCNKGALQIYGPPGCPKDSIMGYGSATVEVPFGGTEILYENTRATIFMAPLRQGNISLLFYVDGESPVAAQIVFPGTVLPATAPYGGNLTTTIPLIESVPEAPDAAILNLKMTLGPSGITYYEYAKHHKIAYQPRGILLPEHCPPHGFPFAANLTFADNTQTNTQTTVPCPKRARRSVVRTF
jgi:hypothetical protein